MLVLFIYISIVCTCGCMWVWVHLGVGAYDGNIRSSEVYHTPNYYYLFRDCLVFNIKYVIKLVEDDTIGVSGCRSGILCEKTVN